VLGASALVAVGWLVAVLAPAAGRPHQFARARVIHDGADTGGPMDVLSASLRQEGRDLVLAVATRKKWAAGSLAGGGSGTVCLLLPRQADPLQLCLTGSASAVSLTRGSRRAGRARTKRDIPAAVTYSQRYARARVALSDLGVLKGELPWQVRTKWSDAKRCGRTTACTDVAPDGHDAAFQLEEVRPRGCRVPRTGYFTNAPRRRRTVALTFDDGPGRYTSSVLAVLKREHVPATFFVIGRQVGPNAALVRREVAAGHVVGDHTWDHANVAGGGGFAAREIASTRRAIRRATGFEPCLFRAPEGVVSGALIRGARAQSLATIGWDVDPADWAKPGADAIYSRIVASARPGSIVVMHDGGGRRDQTVAALPRVIATLRARGYGFATVPDLLGGGVIYAP
jgi:peptidoglycan/xylan/chitin deacetylase (PgdA/CDA1 family)